MRGRSKPNSCFALDGTEIFEFLDKWTVFNQTPNLCLKSDGMGLQYQDDSYLMQDIQALTSKSSGIEVVGPIELQINSYYPRILTVGDSVI